MTFEPNARRPDPPTGATKINMSAVVVLAIGVVSAVLLCILTLARIDRLPFWLLGWSFIPTISAELSDDTLAATAANWVPRELALAIEFDKWCRRVNTPDCSAEDADLEALSQSNAFLTEFDATRAAFIAGLPKLALSGSTLAKANLQGANMAGSDLLRVNLTNANLADSVFEDATLEDTILDGADFFRADMRSADIDGFADRPVRFNLAGLDQASIRIRGGADISFNSASLAGARLFGPLMGDFVGTDLTDAHFTGVFTGSFSADQSAPNFIRGDFPSITWKNSLMRLETDVFGGEFLWGSNFLRELDGTERIEQRFMTFPGSAISAADFSGANRLVMDDLPLDLIWERVLRNSFGNLDRVALPPDAKPPCQWVAFGHRNIKFIAAWRAWLERGGQPWPPFPSLASHSTRMDGKLIGFHEIPADDSLLPPKESCDWILEE